jgi:MFS family permease
MAYQADVNRESRGILAAKSVVVLSGLVLVITVPFAMVTALPEMARHFGESGNGAFIAQMILALPVLAMLIGAPLGGWIADLIGNRRCLLAALATYVAMGAICLIAPNLLALIVARLVLGFSAGAAATLCTALTAEWYQGSERNGILGYAHTVVLAYNILMLVSGGWLVDHFGWRAPSAFYIVGAITFGCAYVATEGQKSKPANETHTGKLSIQRGLWPLYLLTFILALGPTMPVLQGPFLLAAAGITGAADRAMVLVVTIVSGAFASAAYGRLRRRLKNSTLILITGFSMGIGIALSGIGAKDIGFIALSYMVTGIGYGLFVPVIAAIVLEYASPNLRNRAIGFMNGSMLVATVANPIVISFVRRSFDLPNTFIVVGAALVLVGPLFVYMFPSDLQQQS